MSAALSEAKQGDPLKSLRALAYLAAGILLNGTGCSAGSARSNTGMVVGIESDDMGSVVGRVHVVTQVDGTTAADDTLYPPEGGRGAFPPPSWEQKLIKAPSGNDSAQVAVTVLAFDGPDKYSHMVIRRLASTQLVPGKTMLLRIHLESRCLMYAPSPADAGTDAGPGPLSGPQCHEGPMSCIDGQCQDGTVAPSQLEPYTPDWPAHPPDACKGANAGPPELQPGTGENDFAPLTDGQTLQAVRGPQGGHHIWIALRQKNLTQTRSITTVSGVAPDTGAPVPASSFPYAFDPDVGGYCKLYGLRFQLDSGGVDYTQFLGKPLDVTVKVVDSAGVTTSATAHVNIATTVVAQQ